MLVPLRHECMLEPDEYTAASSLVRYKDNFPFGNTSGS